MKAGMAGAERIIELSLDEALGDLDLMTEARSLIGESYEEPERVREQAFERSDRGFFCFVDEALAGFFMFRWSTLAIDSGTPVDVVYVGLVVVRQRAKGRGIGRRLFERLVAQAEVWQRENRKKLYFWLHTASPFVLRSWWNITDEILPSSHGRTDVSLRRICSALKATKGYRASTSDELCVIRAATWLRYTPAERDRVKSAMDAQNRESTFLKRLQIDERQGDRVLVVGAFPQPSDRPKP